MVFKDYIDSLPNVRLDTINKIAEVTCSSKVTVYRWMAGDIEPPMIKKKAIAEYLGMSIEELFPITKNNRIMKTNLITASKALQIMKDSSSIDKIMDAIKKSAAEGYGYVICSVPQSKDLEYLRELGYSIVAEKFREKEYKISWDVSDN